MVCEFCTSCNHGFDLVFCFVLWHDYVIITWYCGLCLTYWIIVLKSYPYMVVMWELFLSNWIWLYFAIILTTVPCNPNLLWWCFHSGWGLLNLNFILYFIFCAGICNKPSSLNIWQSHVWRNVLAVLFQVQALVSPSILSSQIVIERCCFGEWRMFLSPGLIPWPCDLMFSNLNWTPDLLEKCVFQMY